jgi:hypothetical protein
VQGRWRRWRAAAHGRRSRRRRCRGSPGAWTPRIDVRCSCEAGGGQRDPRADDGEKSGWRKCSPVAALLAEFGEIWAGVEGRCCGETPGSEGVLLRCLAGAPVRRSGMAAAAQGPFHGGAARAQRIRFWGGAGVENEVQRGAGGTYRAAERPWGAPPGWKPRRGSRCDSCASGGRGGDEAARWGCLVSEGKGDA